MNNDIYKMKLHEIITLPGHAQELLSTTVTRVPGGWLYRSLDKSTGIMGMTFVTFNNEFWEEISK